jgi:hypothetical protein
VTNATPDYAGLDRIHLPWERLLGMRETVIECVSFVIQHSSRVRCLYIYFQWECFISLVCVCMYVCM